jgi:MFS family permease
MNDTASRRNISLGLLSGAIIAYQIALMNAFSLIQWDHFASMMISLALLGFGAGGTVLTLFKTWLTDRQAVIIPLLMILCAFSLALAFPLSRTDGIRFDSYLLLTGGEQILRFILTANLLFLPFFFGGLAIGMLFTVRVKSISTLYAFNLAGSGVGGILVLLLFSRFEPHHIPILLASIPLAAGLLYPKKRAWQLLYAAGGFTLLTILLVFFSFPEPSPSQFKGIRSALQLPEAQCVYEKPTPYGYLQIVKSPALRYAPGLSLQYRDPIPSRPVLFSNGNQRGPLAEFPSENTHHLYEWSTLNLPYTLRKPDKILILNAGTGDLVSHALSHHPKQITACESNEGILLAIKGFYGENTPFASPLVNVHISDAYTYLLSTRETYDLIQLPVLGTFGGSSGLDALEEHYSLTLEAFETMWQRLEPDGMISVSTWMDYPSRYPLRILTTLKRLTCEDPFRHLAAIRNWNMITFLMKKTPLSSREIQTIKTFSDSLDFDVVLLPAGNRDSSSYTHHQLQNSSFFHAVEAILGNNEDSFSEEYPFRIQPARENSPYFSQFLKPGRIHEIMDYLSRDALPFLELGYLILILTFIVVTLIAVILIIVPLIFHQPGVFHSKRTLLYFSGLGLAFMFVEIVLIQRFILFFGNPLYAASAVISGILIFSGAGSYFSTRLESSRQTITYVSAGISVFLLLLALGLTPVLKAVIHYPFILKIFISLLIVGPVAFLMGIPFPLGLKRLNQTNPADISWAWGINGCLSVISSVLAAILAVEIGFTGVMIIAAILYLGVLSSVGAKRRSR